MYFLNINKPKGITSFDVIRALRKRLKVKQIGHSGTLDPLASGVMQVAVDVVHQGEGIGRKLIKYAEELAVDVELLCKSLERKGNSNIIFQICKSSSSVFANISEAQYPQSLADMHSKLEIARKECAETESWLKLIFASGAIDEETFKLHRNLCGRIKRMLTASCVTIEKRLKQG